MTVLRRLDRVLAPTKAAVQTEYNEASQCRLKSETFLVKEPGLKFWSTSSLHRTNVIGDHAHIGENLRANV